MRRCVKNEVNDVYDFHNDHLCGLKFPNTAQPINDLDLTLKSERPDDINPRPQIVIVRVPYSAAPLIELKSSHAMISHVTQTDHRPI